MMPTLAELDAILTKHEDATSAQAMALFLDVCKWRDAFAGTPAPETPAHKPFTMNASREWCLRMAELEAETMGAAPETPAPDANRCAVCGWPLDPTKQMCRRGDCLMRPLPERAYDPARAVREYEATWKGMAGGSLIDGSRRQEAQLSKLAPGEMPPSSTWGDLGRAAKCSRCNDDGRPCSHCEAQP